MKDMFDGFVVPELVRNRVERLKMDNEEKLIEAFAAALRRRYWEEEDPNRGPWATASETSRESWRRVAREARDLAPAFFG